MPLFPRLLTLLLLAAGTAHVPAATTTSSESKSKGKTSSGTSSSSSKSKSGSATKSDTGAKSKSDSSDSAKPETQAEKKAEEAVTKEDTPKAPRPAAVSTMSIEEIRDFDKYPKQVQSLVQSALALTHLELSYMYGSHEPNKGGMDCSGTMYHLLHFQGLKDVPRQSDEMAMWVEKKSQLHLTPTATDFDSPEFADLKPGDLLFWTNTTATTRKLPVTHVMVYLGKRKKDGKRIIFGSSDGRSFSGMRRSGVSVFDFNLPRAEGTARLHGYGPAPGLLPQEVVLASTVTAPKPPATPPAAPTPAVTVTAPVKEEPKQETQKTDAPPAPLYVKREPKAEPAKVAAAAPDKGRSTSSTEAKVKEEMPPPAPVKEPIVAASTTPTSPPPPVIEAKEEVRKAVAVATDNDGTAEDTAESAAKAKVPADTSEKEAPRVAASSSSKPKSSTATKPKSSTSTATKKKSVQVSSKRRTPAPPPKNQVEQAFDRAVNSVRRVFR